MLSTTIFFDIDGTLLSTRGAGFAAMRVVLNSMFGVDEIPQIVVHGRTDVGIVQDVFDFHGIDYAAARDDFFERYVEQLALTLPNVPGHVLPGVHQLMGELRVMPGVTVGLLTGNCRGAARLKLQHLGLWHYFDDVGGYGCRSHDRNEVAEQALADAQTKLGSRFDRERVWVVGDTLNDVRCARHIGARVVAVATGGDPWEVLSDAQPDLLVRTLKGLDIRSWLGD